MKGLAKNVSVDSRCFINPLQPGKDVILRRTRTQSWYQQMLLCGHWASIFSSLQHKHATYTATWAHPSTSYQLFPWTHCRGPPGWCECKATHRDKQLCALATAVWLCQLAEQAWLQTVGWSQGTWREPTQGRGRRANSPQKGSCHRNRTPDLLTVQSHWATLPPTYAHTYIQYTCTYINTYICMHCMHVALPQDWITLSSAFM